MENKIKVKRVKTTWGQLYFVRAKELKNESLDKIHICNQYGQNKNAPPSKGMFQFAPPTVYRANLAL